MNFQWILLALFLIAIVRNLAKAMRNPMLKNFLRLISILVAFIITFILQVCGVFQNIAEDAVAGLELASKVPEFGEVINNAIGFIIPFGTTLISPLLFTLAFAIIYFVLKVVHVNLVYRFIKKRQRRKEIKELKLALREEKKLLKKAITDNEERFLSAMEDISDMYPEVDTYEYDALEEEEIDRMVEERIKAEKKNRKKAGFFKESKEHKALSLVCGVVCGFLLFGITWMGLFYTMDVLSDVTDGIKNTNADDTKIYQMVEMVDKHVVTPYEESFVYKLYDSMAMVDLMNYTVRAGGKLEVNGETLYADDIMRDRMMRAVRLACEITSAKSEQFHIGQDISAITNDPLTVSLMADLFVVLMEKVEPVDVESEDPTNAILGNIINAYKGENNRELFIQDLGAVSDIVVIAAENRLLAKIIADSSNMGALLEDRDMIKELVGAMSALTIYAPTMESAFNLSIGMMGQMLAPANNAAGYENFVNHLVNAADGITTISNEDLTKFNSFMVNASASANVFAYIREPIDYISNVIKPEALDLKDQIEAKAEEIRVVSEQLAGTTLTDEEREQFLEQLTELEAEEQVLLDREVELLESSEEYIADFEERVKGFYPLISYFTNWMNVQKSFMIAGEDNTTACLAIEVDSVIYVCNTDIITLDMLLDFTLDNDNEGGEEEGGEGADEGADGDESVDDIVNVDIDAYLDQIPMRELLEQLTITSDLTEMEGRVSEITDLVNYIILRANADKNQAESVEINNEWLYSTLGSYCAMSSNPEKCYEMADKIVQAKDAPETFNYLGATVEKMQSSMHFGEEWTDEAKKADSEQLVEIIFTLIDLMKDFDDNEAETVAEGDEVTDNAEIETLIGLFKTLGVTMDQMANTTCLKDLPPIMIDSILKNEKLSMAMTPSMLYGEDGYMTKLESGDISYEEFMEELADTITSMLEKIKDNSEEEGTV